MPQVVVRGKVVAYAANRCSSLDVILMVMVLDEGGGGGVSGGDPPSSTSI